MDTRNYKFDELTLVGPRPLALESITVFGDFAARSVRNYARLEGDSYRPWEVFGADVHGWPGDWEGRLILALVSHARASGREPAWLEAIIDAIPAHLNESGFFGNARQPGELCDEQQMAGHSWLLRGLCAYLEWKGGDARVQRILDGVLEGLILPAAEDYRHYPITREQALSPEGWKMSPLQSKGSSHAMTSDWGCAFILLDGLSHALQVLGQPRIQEMLEIMVERFEQLDLEGMNVQTHATLSACRGLFRYGERIDNEAYVGRARAVFDRYKAVAMTEHYCNYNWWGRPRWTEPCAVIDSFILSTWLWRYYGEPAYLADAHHIYYNGIAHAYRHEGCFGTDWCVGAHNSEDEDNPDSRLLAPRTYEVYWCCNMRGGEFFARAQEALCYEQDGTLYLPFFNNAIIRHKALTLGMKTCYPVEGSVELEVIAAGDEELTLALFLPPWAAREQLRLTLNGQAVAPRVEKGFTFLTARPSVGDRIEYDFGLGFHVAEPVNENTIKGAHSFRHGPLLLARKQVAPDDDAGGASGEGAIDLPANAPHRYLGNAEYEMAGDPDLILAPLFSESLHTHSWHERQALFHDS